MVKEKFNWLKRILTGDYLDLAKISWKNFNWLKKFLTGWKWDLPKIQVFFYKN